MATSPPVCNNKIREVLQSPNMNETSISNDAKESTQNGYSDVAIAASQIVSRLEQASVNKKRESSATPPKPQSVFLGPKRKADTDIIESLNRLMVADDDGDIMPFPPIDEVSRVVLVSHSVSAMCGALESAQSQRVSTQVTTEVTRWLSTMFGILDCGILYHEDLYEGLVRLTRAALAQKPAQCDPVIYSGTCSPLGAVHQVCRHLGLALSCVRPVPAGLNGCLDTAALQSMISEDVALKRTPLLVIGDAGVAGSGRVDDLQRLHELCRGCGAWLHVRGHSLAALALPVTPRSTEFPAIADSFTLDLASWLGVVGLPAATFYRLRDQTAASAETEPLSPTENSKKQSRSESTASLIAGLGNDHSQKRIITIPLWVGLQALGKDGFHSRIRDAFQTVERMYAIISKQPKLRILSPKPGGGTGAIKVDDIITKPLDILILLEAAVTCIVFQFIPPEGVDARKRVPPYYDKLNSWLGLILQLDAPQVSVQICDIDGAGVAVRWSPFEHNWGGHQASDDEIDQFGAYLEQQLDILEATVKHKKTFIESVKRSPVLRYVELPDWAGLGGVRYIPEGWEQLLTDQAKEELNQLNVALVEALRDNDLAFSLGEGADGLICVRFGMLTSNSDVDELLSLVIEVGKSVEESSRVLDSMSEIVKKGIEAATLDLQRENEERIWQEGILRHVPVVGSLVNWWSPKAKEAGVRGRSLDLTQGVVESTENIYKYHMQLPGKSGGGGGSSNTTTRSTPTPQIQTPIGGGSAHSRSSSRASNQSATNVSVDGKLPSSSIQKAEK